MKRSPMPKPTKPINRRSKKRGKVEYADSKDREICRERTSICEKCGERPATEVHHLRTKAAAPALRHEPSNMIHLCLTCHRWAHGNILDMWQWAIDNGKDSPVIALQAMLNLKRGA